MIVAGTRGVGNIDTDRFMRYLGELVGCADLLKEVERRDRRERSHNDSF